MRLTICLAAAFSLSATAATIAAKTAPFQLNKTSWTYVDKGSRVRESIDADGNYITNSVAGKHLDHGTAVMKDDKACFSSAMTKEGEECWSTPGHELKIGHSFVTHNDKGRKLKVTRIAYRPLSMPK